MKRGKPKPSNEHAKYIEQVAANLISSAGTQYERFIKTQVSTMEVRKMLVQRHIQEKKLVV